MEQANKLFFLSRLIHILFLKMRVSSPIWRGTLDPWILKVPTWDAYVWQSQHAIKKRRSNWKTFSQLCPIWLLVMWHDRVLISYHVHLIPAINSASETVTSFPSTPVFELSSSSPWKQKKMRSREIVFPDRIWMLVRNLIYILKLDIVYYKLKLLLQLQ